MVWLQAAVVATVFSSAGETVLLDFYADWCGPCRAMQPTIDALVEQGCPVRKVNVDRDPQLARKFGVGPVPCYVMLVDGREVDRVVGGTTFSRLRRMWELALARRPQTQSPPVPAQETAAKTRPPVAIPAVQSAPPLAAAVQQPGQTRSAPAPPAARWAGTASARTPQRRAGHENALPMGRRSSAPAWIPRGGAGATLDAALIASSVRLRIEDADGHSCGSGTIIDARQGEALILTCGHIFRDSQGKGRIEVDLFGPGGVQRVAGNLISYDLKRDVGLISIRTPGPVATAQVALPGYQIAPGNPVVSVGCNNGDRPTARRSRVTSMDKFLGPPNLQVAGLPVEGRSGGGLFSGDGLVIGVCNAADPIDKEGLYAALASIHAALDEAQLSYICKPGDPSSPPRPSAAAPPTELATVDPPPVLPKRMPGPSEPAPAAELPARPAAASSRGATPLSIEEQAALQGIRTSLQEGAQVICVVLSRSDPQAKSEVIILDRVSPDFLKQLAAEARTQDPLLSTSLEVPRKRPPTGGPLRPENSRTSVGVAPAPWRPPAGNRAGSTGGWLAR